VHVQVAHAKQYAQQLSANTQRFLAVAAAIGQTFDIQIVSAFLENSDHSDSDSSEDGSVGNKLTHAWVSGLQSAISEGMVTAVGHGHLLLFYKSLFVPTTART
jgi:predicted ATPase